MTFEDVKFLAKSLFGIGPILALSTVGYVWCSGFLRVGIDQTRTFSTNFQTFFQIPVSLLVIYPPSKNGVLGLLNFIVFFTWLPLVITSYFRSLLLGPGFAPFKWTPSEASDSQFLQFCTFCEGYKPPRAHHCRR